ncbi:MAG TPA: 3-deoxy-manno-octulosonate cytidylyltransferase [Pyrinomonadaceae bacterium]|nr:3-deoxy-manno-octulosonate cytidylyltransferase [Pyrinomonadaceae bacterium]
MEQHGENPRKNVTAVIPARFDSVRLGGKLLLPLAGKPLILHTLEQTKKARNVFRVIVATDDERILRAVEESGNEAVLTSKNHQSGSDRIAEVAANLPENSIIVNVQGDEPLISPGTIEKAVDAILQDESVEMATVCEPIFEIKDVLSPDVVKVVTDENGFALYFSRSPIPFPREAVRRYGSLENALKEEKDLLSLYRKHTGIYVYRREFLLKFTKLPQTFLEKTEMLEQLRALESGARIKVVEVAEKSIGVDTREDFERVREILESQTISYREARAEDIPQIARVHVESWQKSFAGITPQEHLDKMSVENRIGQFEKAFSQNSFYKMFVAETVENKIVGFADFGESRIADSFDAQIYAIYFLPEFQRKGIGGNLFRLCQKEMSARGFKSMCLDTLEISPYRSFYEKMGGQIVGENRHYLAGIEYKTVIYGWSDLNEKI